MRLTWSGPSASKTTTCRRFGRSMTRSEAPSWASDPMCRPRRLRRRLQFGVRAEGFGAYAIRDDNADEAWKCRQKKERDDSFDNVL